MQNSKYHGKYYVLPLPGGQGKALRLSQPGNSNIPLYLAILKPQALEYSGAMADGWLGTSFTTEHAAAHLDYPPGGAKELAAARPTSKLRWAARLRLAMI